MARTTAANLRLVRGIDVPEVGASLREDGVLAVELARSWTAPVGTLVAEVEPGPPEEMQRYRTAIEGTRGVLLLVPHIGNWEVLSLWLQGHARRELPFTALYEPARHPGLDAWILAARTRSGARLVPTGTAGVRALLRTLEAGGTAALLPDQVPPRGSGVHASFFGRPASTLTLVRGLVRRTDPVVLAAAAIRDGDRWVPRFLDADPAIGDEDPVRAAAALNATVEACVRLAPAQYQWGYKRFKHPPSGVPDPYRRRPAPAQ